MAHSGRDKAVRGHPGGSGESIPPAAATGTSEDHPAESVIEVEVAGGQVAFTHDGVINGLVQDFRDAAHADTERIRQLQTRSTTSLALLAWVKDRRANGSSELAQTNVLAVERCFICAATARPQIDQRLNDGEPFALIASDFSDAHPEQDGDIWLDAMKGHFNRGHHRQQ